MANCRIYELIDSDRKLASGRLRQMQTKGWLARGAEESFGGDRAFIIMTVVMVSWVYTYVNIYQSVHFKLVWMIAYHFYFN